MAKGQYRDEKGQRRITKYCGCFWLDATIMGDDGNTEENILPEDRMGVT